MNQSVSHTGKRNESPLRVSSRGHYKFNSAQDSSICSKSGQRWRGFRFPRKRCRWIEQRKPALGGASPDSIYDDVTPGDVTA